MRGLLVLLALSTACITPATTFSCATDADCTVGGTCQATGFCSFSDAECASGQRYGDASGNGLAGECVPRTAMCGDGLVEEDEECDDMNDITTDTCVACKRARCGDGAMLDRFEECDDGNTADDDGCTAKCMSCTGGMVGPAGHCYTRVDTTIDWMSAANDCLTRGGYLVSINTAEENAFVTGLLTATSWIGLDDLHEANFYWQDDETPMAYSNFEAGQPNGGVGQNCVAQTMVGEWQDRDCANTMPYVCEKVPWTIDPMTGHAYNYFGGIGERTYAAAVTDCVAKRGHLATITDATENALVDGITGATASIIGLNDVMTEGTYVWETGEPFSFTAWGMGEPGVDDCMVLDPAGAWADNLCSRTSGYLCEIDP
jgi:cysteine-rich repeat protein